MTQGTTFTFTNSIKNIQKLPFAITFCHKRKYLRTARCFEGESRF